jgi:hypothetical protein
MNGDDTRESRKSTRANVRLATTISKGAEDRFAMKLKMTASSGGRYMEGRMMNVLPLDPMRSEWERKHTRGDSVK